MRPFVRPFPTRRRIGLMRPIMMRPFVSPFSDTRFAVIMASLTTQLSAVLAFWHVFPILLLPPSLATTHLRGRQLSYLHLTPAAATAAITATTAAPAPLHANATETSTDDMLAAACFIAPTETSVGTLRRCLRGGGLQEEHVSRGRVHPLASAAAARRSFKERQLTPGSPAMYPRTEARQTLSRSFPSRPHTVLLLPFPPSPWFPLSPSAIITIIIIIIIILACLGSSLLVILLPFPSLHLVSSAEQDAIRGREP